MEVKLEFNLAKIGLLEDSNLHKWCISENPSMPFSLFMYVITYTLVT